MEGLINHDISHGLYDDKMTYTCHLLSYRYCIEKDVPLQLMPRLFPVRFCLHCCYPPPSPKMQTSFSDALKFVWKFELSTLVPVRSNIQLCSNSCPVREAVQQSCVSQLVAEQD